MKKDRPSLVIGFAAETNTIVANATAKLQRKKCDWIVANDVSPETGIMGGLMNEITLISKTGAEAWPRMSKEDVAKQLAERVAKALC
jgi:phosphopantothenoylcysteine decarboxylase/phosphopantothenate--cysteine ligase